MGTVFRPARPEEIEELVALLALVFDGGGTFFRRIIEEDPWRALGRTFVAEENGRLVANVQVHCRPVRVGRATLTMGGIGHVATHPDFRRRGIAGRLLEEQIAFMRATGYHLSQLYTGINHYYETYGWRTIPLTDRRLQLANWAPRGGDGGYVLRPVTVPEGLPELAPVYEAAADRWLTPLARTEAYWRAHPAWTLGEFLGEDPAACIAAERAGRLCGYARGRIAQLGPDRAALDELCWLPGEEACLAPLAERFLAAAHAAGKTFVDLGMGEAHPALASLGGEEALEEVYDYHAMFRVIDLEGLLRALTPELERRLAAAGLAVLTPLTLDAEIGCARLEARPGLTVADHEGPADLTMTHATFLKLLLGRESAADLAAKREIEWQGPDRTEELAALFPRRPYYYCRYDKF